MKLSDKISLKLQDWTRTSGYDIIIPNYFYGHYEMDLFRLVKSGYITEYEIKISRSDYFADFKKYKKHERFLDKTCYPNRFYYVVPEDLIKESEVPKYAGLIYYVENHLYIVKNASIIHKNMPNNDIYRRLAQSLEFREQHHRGKARFYKIENIQLKIIIDNLNKQINEINTNKTTNCI